MTGAPEKPAVVLGCHKIGLGIIRALGSRGVPVIGASYSSMDMGFASRYVKEHYKCAHPDKDPEAFLAQVQKIAERWDGAVLIPSDDATLIPVSRYKETLSRHFKVVADDWNVVEQCIEKKYTYALAERVGVLCPKTTVPPSLDAAREFAREIGFPCLLKPTVGHSFFEKFKQKMFFVRGMDELESLYALLADAGIETMLQEYIPGDDKSGANFNSFFAGGETLVEVTAEKVRLSPPRIGFPRVVVSKRLSELSGPANRLLSGLGYNGFSCMEFKKDARDGKYRLMEVNARLNLSTPLSVKAGVNFPYIVYRHALHGEVPRRGGGFREDIYWIDLGKDITESVRSFPRERFRPAEYLRPYLRPHVYTIISAGDMGPAIKRGCDLAVEGTRRLFGRLSGKGPR